MATLNNFGPVVTRTGAKTLSGESGDYVDIGHANKLKLANATFALTFSLDQVWGTQALISKDGAGQSNAGFTV